MTLSKIKAVGMVVGIASVMLLGALPVFVRPKAAPPVVKPIASISFIEAKSDDQAPKREAEIVVLDSGTGKPIPGAFVRTRIDSKYLRSTTDAQGLSKVDLSSQRLNHELNVDVWADGYIQQRFYGPDSRQQEGKKPNRVEFRLHKGEETLGGIVKDEQGKPISGVNVRIWGYLGEKKDPKRQRKK